MLQILLTFCLMFFLSKNSFLIFIWVLCNKIYQKLTTDATCLKVVHTCFCNYFLIKKYSKTYPTYFVSFLIGVGYKHVNISMLDQCCFNILDQRWGPRLKMKQNPMSDFQHCTTLIQQWCTTLKNRCTTSFQCCINVYMTLSNYCFKVVSASVKPFENQSG